MGSAPAFLRGKGVRGVRFRRFGEDGRPAGVLAGSDPDGSYGLAFIPGGLRFIVSATPTEVPTNEQCGR
jgi:hypothetical protein